MTMKASVSLMRLKSRLTHRSHTQMCVYTEQHLQQEVRITEQMFNRKCVQGNFNKAPVELFGVKKMSFWIFKSPRGPRTIKWLLLQALNGLQVLLKTDILLCNTMESICAETYPMHDKQLLQDIHTVLHELQAAWAGWWTVEELFYMLVPHCHGHFVNRWKKKKSNGSHIWIFERKTKNFLRLKGKPLQLLFPAYLVQKTSTEDNMQLWARTSLLLPSNSYNDPTAGLF